VEQHKSQKLQRLSVWERTNGTPNLTTNQNLEPAGSFSSMPDSVKFYKFKKSWGNSEDFSLHAISEENLHELRSLTACEFARDPTQIYIGGHSEESCHLAIVKLDTIFKYSTYSVSVPFFLVGNQKSMLNFDFEQDPKTRPMKHAFYTENLSKVKFKIRAFPKVTKKFFQNTLLDNLQLCRGNDYSNLWQGTSIRLATYGSDKLSIFIPYKSGPLVPATQLSEAQAGSRRFGPDFTYNSRNPPHGKGARWKT
jgi:hypothetical protein